MTKSIIESLREIVEYCKDIDPDSPDTIKIGDREYEQLIEELKVVHVYEPRSLLNTKDIILWGVKIERLYK